MRRHGWGVWPLLLAWLALLDACAAASSNSSNCSVKITQVVYHETVLLSDFHKGADEFLRIIKGTDNVSEIASRMDEIKRSGHGVNFGSIWSLAKTQIGLLVCLALGVAFIALTPLTGLICICMICCCSSSGRKPSTAYKWCYTAFCIFILAGMIVVTVFAGLNSRAVSLETYSVMVNKTGVSALDFAKELRCTSNRFNGSIDAIEEGLKESVDRETKRLRGMLSDGIDQAMENITTHIRTNLNIVNESLKEVDTAFNNAQKNVHEAVPELTKANETLQPAMAKVEKLSEDPLGELKISQDGLNKTIEKALDPTKLKEAIHNHTDNIYESLSFLTNDSLNQLEATIRNQTDFVLDLPNTATTVVPAGKMALDNLSWVVLGLLILPMILVMVFAMVALCLGWACSDTSLPNQFIRCSGGCFFVFGWMGMIFTTVVFVGGYAIHYGCGAVFESDANLATLTQYLASNETMEFLRKELQIRNLEASIAACKNESSLEEVIPAIGDRLKDAMGFVNGSFEDEKSEVNSRYTAAKEDMFKKINNKVFQDEFSDAMKKCADTLEQLTTIEKTVAQGDDHKKIVADLMNSVKKLNTTLSRLMNGPLSKKEVERKLNESLDPVKDNLLVELDKLFPTLTVDLLANVSSMIPTCAPVMTVVKNLEVGVCQQLANPLNGLWLAAGLLLWLGLPLLCCLCPLTNHFRPGLSLPPPRGRRNRGFDEASLETDSSYYHYDSAPIPLQDHKRRRR